MAITVNNRNALLQLQIDTAWGEINERHRLIEALEEAKRAPVEWMEATTKRIVLDNNDIVLLTINAKALIDYLFESDINVEKMGDKSYVYVNFIDPAHEPILLANGAEIETNPNI